MTQSTSAFLFGLGIGAVASLCGAACSYWFGLRRTDGLTNAPLVYLMLTVLVLSVAGAIVSVVSLFAGRTMQALITGGGVIVGFSAVFALLLAFWLRGESD